MPSIAKKLYYLFLASTSLSNSIFASKECKSPTLNSGLDLIFSGSEISDSKTFDNYVVKATGGMVAEVHDDILRRLGLVIKDVPPLEKITAKIKPDGIKPDGINSDEYLTDIIGQRRPEQKVENLDRNQRYDYVKENWQSFLKASMLGVGITDLIYNRNNLVKLKDKITVIDVDAMCLPIIPYEILSEELGINKDIQKDEAKKFFESPEYQELKTKKLELIENCSGKDSAIYDEHKKAFLKIEKHIKDNAVYSPKDFYFGNIRKVWFGQKNDTDFEANFVPLNDKARLELKDNTGFSRFFYLSSDGPSSTPLLCKASTLINLEALHK